MFSQVEKYKSTEEIEYYKNLKHKRFRPYSKRQAKSQKFEHIRIIHDTLQNNEFIGIYDCYKPNYKSIESIKGTHQGTTYELFLTPSLDSGTWGSWLKINSAEKSNSYYLGFSLNYFSHIKAKQTIPLIKNDSIMQVQSAIIRQTKPDVLPDGDLGFKLVKDFIILEIDLNQVIMDTDNDGITDIAENRLMLNPKSKDSDNDGIIDSYDSNPRFESWNSEKSMLYSYVLTNQVLDSAIIDTNIVFKKLKKNKYKNPTLIVTNEESLQHIKPMAINDYYIIMTETEYEKNKNIYPVDINRLYISPLFKVDHVDNCYKIHVGGSSWGNDYMIYKLNGKWIIKNIGGYII